MFTKVYPSAKLWSMLRIKRAHRLKIPLVQRLEQTDVLIVHLYYTLFMDARPTVAESIRRSLVCKQGMNSLFIYQINPPLRR